MTPFTLWRWLALATLGVTIAGLPALLPAEQTHASSGESTESTPEVTPVRAPGAIVLFSGQPEQLREH